MAATGNGRQRKRSEMITDHARLKGKDSFSKNLLSFNPNAGELSFFKF